MKLTHALALNAKPQDKPSNYKCLVPIAPSLSIFV
jgi:hypothetical protein